MKTTSIEQRLNRLLSTKTNLPIASSSDGLAFWERELIASRRQPDVPVLTEVANNTKDLQAPAKKSYVSQRPVELIPGTTPDQIVYLSKGRRNGGIYPSELAEIADDYEPYTEPISSSHELVGQFCIFSQVTKFPYKYMQDPEDRVSRAFFANEKVYERGWNMYYLFGSDCDASKPLMLVPLAQVQTLIEEIADEFQVDVGIPEYPFHLSFYHDGTPTPTHIGRVNSKADFADISSKVSRHSDNHAKPPTHATKIQIQDFVSWEEKIQDAHDLEKKKKLSKGQRKRDRTTFRKGTIKQAQQYLGLRDQPLPMEPIPPRKSGLQQNPHTENKPLDVSLPVPYPFEANTVLISFDVEAWEFDNTAITEIGLSVLDTEDIKSIAPGPTGEEWIKKIRSRHLRIKGREHMRNERFCEGNPEKFRFGTSEFVNMIEASSIVDRCFEYPYLAGYECESPLPPAAERSPRGTKWYDAHHYTVPEQSRTTDPDKPRNLLLVGHSIEGDIDWLFALGSNIFGPEPVSPSKKTSRNLVLSKIREQFDTSDLFQSLDKDKRRITLGKLCDDLGIEAKYPHNAGNDARYTLEAFVKLVIRSRHGNSAQGVSSNSPNFATPEPRQYIPVDVKPDTAQKPLMAGHANAVNWMDPVPDLEQEWRPFSDNAYQDGRGVIESDQDDDDDDDAESSSDELPY